MAGSLQFMFAAVERVRAARLEAEVRNLRAGFEGRRATPSADSLLTSAQVAPLLGVRHPKTVERWVREKHVPCVRIGRTLRFRAGDVLRWVAQRKEG
jgi:excisionase family DNA binding protein